MVFGFTKGWFGHPATKPTGIYAIEDKLSIENIPIIGSIYKGSKMIFSIIIGIILLIIGIILYRKLK